MNQPLDPSPAFNPGHIPARPVLSRTPVPTVLGSAGFAYYEDFKHLLTGRPYGLPYPRPWADKPKPPDGSVAVPPLP